MNSQHKGAMLQRSSVYNLFHQSETQVKKILNEVEAARELQKLPEKRVLNEMCTPEDVCLYEGMMAAKYRLDRM